MIWTLVFLQSGKYKQCFRLVILNVDLTMQLKSKATVHKYKTGALPKGEGAPQKLPEDLQPILLSQVYERILTGNAPDKNEMLQMVSCCWICFDQQKTQKVILDNTGKLCKLSSMWLPRFLKKFPILKNAVRCHLVIYYYRNQTLWIRLGQKHMTQQDTCSMQQLWRRSYTLIRSTRNSSTTVMSLW